MLEKHGLNCMLGSVYIILYKENNNTMEILDKEEEKNEQLQELKKVKVKLLTMQLLMAK